jgi:ferritin-like protein
VRNRRIDRLRDLRVATNAMPPVSRRSMSASAAGLGKGAVSACLGAIPLFENRDLAKAAGSVLGDEAMHWAILRQALGDVPVPDAFVS